MSDDRAARATAQLIVARFNDPDQPAGDDRADLERVAFDAVEAALSSEKAAREAAEKRVGELERVVSLGLQAEQRLFDRSKEAEAALAPLQALVDDARKELGELAAQRLTSEMDEEDRENADWEGGWDAVVTHVRAIASGFSATPTDLLNERLAEVEDATAKRIADWFRNGGFKSVKVGDNFCDVIERGDWKD